MPRPARSRPIRQHPLRALLLRRIDEIGPTAVAERLATAWGGSTDSRVSRISRFTSEKPSTHRAITTPDIFDLIDALDLTIVPRSE